LDRSLLGPMNAGHGIWPSFYCIKNLRDWRHAEMQIDK
jgi:hypothetical protein